MSIEINIWNAAPVVFRNTPFGNCKFIHESVRVLDECPKSVS